MLQESRFCDLCSEFHVLYYSSKNPRLPDVAFLFPLLSCSAHPTRYIHNRAELRGHLSWRQLVVKAPVHGEVSWNLFSLFLLLFTVRKLAQNEALNNVKLISDTSDVL
jgi:hypothetical protein